jgi:two-component system, OmpR family, sensor kinase
LISIQRNLLVAVCAALVAGMLVVMLATYAFAYAQITRVFDDELALLAEGIHLGEEWRGPGRTRMPAAGFPLAVRAYDPRGEMLFDTGDPALPATVPKLFDQGHRLFEIPSGDWRVYTLVAREGVVQVGQPDAVRATLARSLSLRMALPELVLMPPFVLLLGFILRRGLAPLRHISRRVEERDASRLDPLPQAGLPAELQPLIAQINGLLQRLSVSMAVQRRFVADAAHELRTPVAALALQAQVAELADEAGSRRAAFAELHSGIDRVARVVEQLLRLARLAPDVAPQQLCEVDLAELAREVVGELAYQARMREVDLGAEADAPACIWGDKTELRSLVTNLVENAMRYGPRGTQVTVTVSRDSREVFLGVLDGGRGIAAADRERVFNRFQRAAGDRTPGIGLGLAIVKAIVERHAGTVRLEDARPGATPPGLAVRISFPAWQRTQRAALRIGAQHGAGVRTR